MATRAYRANKIVFNVWSVGETTVEMDGTQRKRERNKKRRRSVREKRKEKISQA